MANKKNSSSHPKSETQERRKQASAVILVVVFVLGLIYLFTGVDPLGLFVESADVEVVSGSSDGSGSGWYQVYFTEPTVINNPGVLTGSLPEKLNFFINNSRESIHIAAFEFNLTPVAEALIEAHQRGVEVLWVTDDEHGLEADMEDDHGQFALLQKAGITIRSDDRSALMHNKFLIFDGQLVWTGSTNLTINGNFRNNNNVIVINSPKLAAIYEREFQEMWDGQFGPRSPSTANDQEVVLDTTPIQAYFAAEDDVISRLLPLIVRAKKSIRFMAFSFTHEDLGRAILIRARNGVKIRGIFETRGSETEFSQLPPLYCDGLDVRQDGNPGTFHHKVIVIDDQIVVTGSLNFSANADESNDENVIVINNKDIAAKYVREFEQRWSEAVVPDPADMRCK